MQLGFHRVLVPVLGTKAAASAGTGPLGEAGSTAAAQFRSILLSPAAQECTKKRKAAEEMPRPKARTPNRNSILFFLFFFDRGSQRFWGPVSCRRRHEEQPRIDSTEHLFLTGDHQESPTGGVFSTLQHPKETSESMPFVTGC